jgi:tetratricopeptide (TPR) repeat protein
LQNNTGALPVLYAPHQTFSLLEAPKPLLARTAEKIWNVTKDRDFLVEVIPLLRRHILWLLQHFDPQRRKVYSWQNKKECFGSEHYESECASVDLLVLLLSEISTLNQLQDQLSIQTGEQILYFKEEREDLEAMLQKEFWNKDKGRFNRAYIRDKEVVLEGFYEFFPLLFNETPELQRTEVLNRLYHSSFLPGANEMLSWRVTSPDQTSFPLLQQFILLEILETNDPKGVAARDFTRLLLQGFMEWHTTVVNKNQPIDLDPAMAAFIVTLMATHHYRDRRKTVATHFLGKMQEKLNITRFDVAVFGIVIFAFLASHFIYEHLQQEPPFKILSEEMNTAFFDKDVRKMVKNAELIRHYYPEKAAKARFLLANLSLIHGDLKKAEVLFLKVREQMPDSPAPMVWLGMTYQLQGKFDKANEQYDEFTFLFDEIFPIIVKRVRGYQYMMEEGFKSPPGWRKLYKYKAMNELEPNE